MKKTTYDRVRAALNREYFTTLEMLAYRAEASHTATSAALDELDNSGLVVKIYIKHRKGRGRAAVAYRKVSK